MYNIRLSWNICIFTLLVLIPASAAPKKVFILSGQSNMNGYTNANDIFNDSYFTDYRNGFPVELYLALNGNVIAKKNFYPGYTGMEWSGSSVKGFGPEMGIAKVLTSQMPGEQLVFIKVSWGGTGLAKDWVNEQSGVFLWFKNQVRTALSLIESSSPQGYQISGMFWMQGETDAENKDAAYNYASNLKYFVESMIRPFFVNEYRTHMSLVNFKLPFVFGRIHEHSFYGFSSIVQNEQFRAQSMIACTRCSDDSRTASNWIIPNSYPETLNFAPPHYDSRGYIKVGLGLANTMIDLLNGKTDLGCKEPLGPKSMSSFLMRLLD